MSKRRPFQEPGSVRHGAVSEQHGPAFLFDLDGTLVDSVYQHVLAWREALEELGMGLAVWRIHRRMGMSGGLMANALSREVNRRLNPEETARLLNLHDKHFVPRISQVRALSGAKELLTYLSRRHIPWAIATSGRMVGARPMLKLLGLGSEAAVITREQVKHARPDPDLLLAGAERLHVPISEPVVVGDSVWDLLTARRVRALAIGLLSGGYGQGELEGAGAYRVYEDPADLLQHIDEVGVRSDL